ncbi:hypothetical protein E4U54_000241 [Claviceps lovelessii]|nr:hypothetical protein E4U54_000241 [Claviceps lovelessii]
MKFTIILSLITAALADSHHNCGCSIRGNYDQLLSEFACATWGSHYQPNHSRWGIGRGIDGTGFEIACRQNWGAAYGGNIDDVKGRCWH